MRGKAPDPASPTVSFGPLSYEALNSKAALANSAAFPNARRHAGLPPRIFRRATSITKNVHAERVVRPGAKAELFRKSTRSGRDSGTKTEVSHGSSPEPGRQRRPRDQLSKKTPGHGIPHLEGLRPFLWLPWDTSVFVPESSLHAALRRATQPSRSAFPACACRRTRSYDSFGPFVPFDSASRSLRGRVSSVDPTR